MCILTLIGPRNLTHCSSKSALAPLPQINCELFPKFSSFWTLNQGFLIIMSTDICMMRSGVVGSK